MGHWPAVFFVWRDAGVRLPGVRKTGDRFAIQSAGHAGVALYWFAFGIEVRLSSQVGVERMV